MLLHFNFADNFIQTFTSRRLGLSSLSTWDERSPHGAQFFVVVDRYNGLAYYYLVFARVHHITGTIKH